MKFDFHGNKKILLFVLRSQWNRQIFNEGRDPVAQARTQGGPSRLHPIGGPPVQLLDPLPVADPGFPRRDSGNPKEEGGWE